MAKVSPRPVVIGVGQFTNKSNDPADIKDPYDMIERAVHLAEEDSGVTSLARKVDTLCVVNILSLSDQDPPKIVAGRIGAHPSKSLYTWVGASAPQWFVNRMAEEIAMDRCKVALICGGEAIHSKLLAQGPEKGRQRKWGDIPEKRAEMVGDLRNPLTPLEVRYGMILPVHIYPLFENALRHHQGLSIERHLREIGTFCSKASKIASSNPHAWFRNSKEVEEIISHSPENRVVCFPYRKFMCSIMEVDQSAALFMTDEATAQRLGIPKEKWVYVLGSGDASDIWHVSRRIALHSSPSARVAAQKAVEQAGVSVQEIEYLDFYSCFPCAPRITASMLGISKNDPRPLTVTGSMPYFGGPGNNYALHAICRMTEILRENPEKLGMVQALSWYISKHSVGIYSRRPPKGPYQPVDPKTYQQELDRLEGPEIVEEASGVGTVETFTVIHDREGRPASSIIIGRLEDGRRFLAKAEDREEVYMEMMKKEIIGEKGRVINRKGMNVFSF